LYRTCSYTIKSSILCTGVTVEEKHMSEWTPFLQKFGPVFMEDSSGFSTILLLFLAEVVEFDLLSLRRVFLYIVMNQMCKGDQSGDLG
jgi:hypothetical protein